MRSIKAVVILISLVFPTLAGACPKGSPAQFREIKKVGKSVLYVGNDNSATLGLKCETLSKDEAYRSLQYLKNRTVIDSVTSYESLRNETDFVSRIYFRVSEGELIQVALTASIKTPEQLKALEKNVLDFLSAP